MFLDGLRRQIRCRQAFEERAEQGDQLFAGSQIFFQPHPGARPAVQIPAIVFQAVARPSGSAVYLGSSHFHRILLMLALITILNRCHRFPGFVYHKAHFSSDHKSIEIAVRPRKGAKAVCSRCHQPAPGYDQHGERRFEFIPFWGFLVFLLYSMRRVDCRRCQAVVVEEVPWGDGKRTLTKAYMLFLARWARRLSWKETAEAFRTSWEKVFDAVEHVVNFGLVHRTLGQIDAIGVESFQGFFTTIGDEVASKIVFVCSGMWEPI